MFFAANIAPKQDAATDASSVVRLAPNEQPAPSLAAAKTLTPREIEIARLVTGGMSSKRIVSELNLSLRTVEKHRANIMDKIGVREVASLVRYCVQAGIVKS
jgi:DNA-binding NarL/FixJ family response regulator